ncbi:MAG: hypothetical protein K2O01_09205, partial [Bacteroidales bacterium]|nr:hypothetical protein [Bacteroidales bacterium]
AINHSVSGFYPPPERQAALFQPAKIKILRFINKFLTFAPNNCQLPPQPHTRPAGIQAVPLGRLRD